MLPNWINTLTDCQKNLLIFCCSVSSTTGMSHPLEMYAVTDGLLVNLYTNPHDTANERYRMADDLIEPMILFLKFSLPGYDHVETKEDFLKELKKFYEKTS